MSMTRKAVLTISANPFITRLVSKYGMKLGASRFVAGENMGDTLLKVKELNNEGLLVTLDLLGESVHTREEALVATDGAIRSFDAIQQQGVNSNVSVKLTQLGLDIDPYFCLDNMDRIVAKAKETGNFVRIDMEDSPRIDATMDIFSTLLEKYGRDHIGLVIQSYLYRSDKDVEQLGTHNVNLRIVKGAYKEPKEVAYPEKKDVDEAYRRLVASHLRNGCYTAIATHDIAIIQWAKTFVKENNISTDLFEFQMLYGIATSLQLDLAREGYKVRVYTPYGKDWYPYFSRRIAERPANALFILKSLFRK
ncbi:proline dehydrogenase family protein [Marininema halotolerans]|uniref:proline dehydrogenase n=1 Tax=Marininema halotolerans TaxID=1155944 RepID=A0A1I6NRM9_9BACL|nr:proline dehydrogenase family protein [Marininema halotolerans]SFS30646.1 proline dehydrogenase [Marininema halotolerans]